MNREWMAQYSGLDVDAVDALIARREAARAAQTFVIVREGADDWKEQS